MWMCAICQESYFNGVIGDLTALANDDEDGFEFGNEGGGNEDHYDEPYQQPYQQYQYQNVLVRNDDMSILRYDEFEYYVFRRTRWQWRSVVRQKSISRQATLNQRHILLGAAYHSSPRPIIAVVNSNSAVATIVEETVEGTIAEAVEATHVFLGHIKRVTSKGLQSTQGEEVHHHLLPLHHLFRCYV